MNKQFQQDYERFKNLSYEDFKALAKDESLSVYQKIGFPDEYRKGKEKDIFIDIGGKLGWQNETGKTILDIGCGCSDLVNFIIDHGKNTSAKLLLVDSAEMLQLVKNELFIEKYAGYFPNDTKDLTEQYAGKVDYIIAYSIFHYIFYNTCMFRFLDTALSLLKPGGKMLLADIPNVDKRKRFFSSDRGVQSHKEFMNDDSMPVLQYNTPEPGQIDDSIINAILQRYRNFGYETYLLSQPENLPMWNRRDDILIQRI